MLRRGFTLLETVIYVLLLSFVLAGSFSFLRFSLDHRARVQATFVLGENLRFAFLRMETRIQSANQVFIPTSGVSSTSLTLTMPSVSQSPSVFTLNGGTITLSEAGNPALPLTSNEVEITSLVFTHLQGTPSQVRMVMSGRMRNAAGPYQANITLTDTASIRR